MRIDAAEAHLDASIDHGFDDQENEAGSRTAKAGLHVNKFFFFHRNLFGTGDVLEEAYFIWMEDVDFCLRVQEAGYVNVWTPYAQLYHHESATRGVEDSPEKQNRFNGEVAYMAQRWPSIRDDYAYNPNLTLEHLDFGLAWPPRVDD